MGMYSTGTNLNDENLEDEDLEDEDIIPEGEICEYCDALATFVTPDGLYLCEHHYDEYVDGWSRED